MHKFEAINRKKLDNPKRREILPPEETLMKLGLNSDDIVADIGCGIGYFTFPAANIVNKNNEVYALDISNEMLDDIKNKMNENNIRNITCIKTEEYDLKLEDEAVTFAIMVNVLHEIEDKIKMLKEIKRILKSSGKIAIIDFEKKETEEGPPVGHRIAKEELLDLYKICGFEVINEMSFSNIFYGFIAKNCY